MIHKLNDIFTPSQVESLNEIVDRLVIPKVDNSPGSQYVSSINNNGTGVCEELGRLQVSDIWSSEELLKKINQIVRSLTDMPLSLKHSMYVEYSNKYGIPNLPPHFDKQDKKGYEKL
jgi:heptaprenylglyceryl phosphate synthase